MTEEVQLCEHGIPVDSPSACPGCHGSLSSNELVRRLRDSWREDTVVLCRTAADELERAQRIMRRAISWLQIKEAAFATAKGTAIIEEMQQFCAGASEETFGVPPEDK